MLTSERVMAHYNPAAPPPPVAGELVWGPFWFGGQQGVVRPVAYASRTVTPVVERRYS